MKLKSAQPKPYASQLSNVLSAIETFLWFFNESPYARLSSKEGVYDFALGNPHEMPLPGFAQALQTWAVPQNDAWFAYKMSEPASRETAAAALSKRTGVAFSPDDMYMTNGAFAALSITVKTILEPEDEIIYVSPPWFFYKAIIVSHYGAAVRVPCDPASFLPDLDAIRRAITPRTRAILINSPNNPTGRVYPPAFLTELANLLNDASQHIQHPILLISDESYSRILFSGVEFHSPAEFYPHTFVIYTYGKTLLTPGQRIGYIALPQAMPQREQYRPAILAAQIVGGYSFPNALLQHALPDLENLIIDLPSLERRRARLVRALGEMGYETSTPQGTFYLLARSPIPNDLDFITLLGEENILCLPGSAFEMAGYFRISLTASDAMVEGALPGFARALARVRR